MTTEEVLESIRINNPDYKIGDEVAVFINEQIAFDGYLVAFRDNSGKYIDEPDTILENAKSVDVAVKNKMRGYKAEDGEYFCIKNISMSNFLGVKGRRPLLDVEKRKQIVDELNRIGSNNR